MAQVIAGMTMSLDGYVADAEGSLGPLYPDFEELGASDYMRALQAETGAVVMGRRTFDAAGDPDSYADDYEFQVPIFVLTHTPPDVEPRRNENLSVTFVTDGLDAAVTRARAAAGERDVTVVGGADVIRQLLAARLVDVLSIDVVPVLLGDGLRLFAGTGPAALDVISAEQVGVRTSLRYRVGSTG